MSDRVRRRRGLFGFLRSPDPAAESATDQGQGDGPVHETHLHRTLHFLSERVDKIAVQMEKGHLHEYVQLAVRPWKLIWLNLIYGTARGIGIAIGFTFFAATIVWLLQVIGKLNLPIVGDYIADIVRIVQRQLQIRPY